MLDKIAPYWKAVVAFFAPGLVIVANILATSGRWPTVPEWLTALGVALVTALGVYGVPNQQPAPDTEDVAPADDAQDGTTEGTAGIDQPAEDA